MVLREIAHVRTGDKGDISQICVIVHEPEAYPLLARSLTCERVREHLRISEEASILRYEVPAVGAVNFVVKGLLRGGVTRSLALDPHGKTIGAQLLDLTIGNAEGRERG